VEPNALDTGRKVRTCNACGYEESELLNRVSYNGEPPEHPELGEPIASGEWSMVTWTLYGDGTLTIFSRRTMEGSQNYRWKDYANQIKRIILEEGIARIAREAFSNLPNLETVILPNSMMEIGEGAFYMCPKLKTIVLPEKVREIKQRAFAGGENLSEVYIMGDGVTLGREIFCQCIVLDKVYFLGDAPKMEMFAFRDAKFTAYYPADNATWTDDLLKDYGGDVTWTAGDPAVYAPTYYKKRSLLQLASQTS